MLLCMIQPIAMICNRRGEMIGIRVVKVTADVLDKVVPDAIPNMIYQDIRKVTIKRIVKKSVHTVSLLKTNRDVELRKRLYRDSKYGWIKGAVQLPVIRADGSVLYSHLYAVIGSKQGIDGKKLGTPCVYFDYKGTMYTQEQLREHDSAAADQVFKLYGHAHKHDVHCCWINSPYCNKSAYMQDKTKASLYSTLQDEQAKRDMAVHEMVQKETVSECVTLEVGEWTYTTMVNKKALVSVPHGCSKVRVNSGTMSKEHEWRLHGTSDVANVQLRTHTMPCELSGFDVLYTYICSAMKSPVPLSMPKMRTAPVGYGSTYAVYVSACTYAPLIDLSENFYDGQEFTIGVEMQPSTKLIVPQASRTKVELSLDRPQFSLQINAPQYSGVFMSALFYSSLTVALSIDVRKTHALFIKLQDTKPTAHTVICLDSTIKVSAETQTAKATIHMGTVAVPYLTLTTASTLETTLQGTKVDILEHCTTWATGRDAITHIYAQVDTLVCVMTETLAGKEHIYLHNGVHCVIFIYTNCAPDCRREICERMRPILHVPVGSKEFIEEVDETKLDAATEFVVGRTLGRMPNYDSTSMVTQFTKYRESSVGSWLRYTEVNKNTIKKAMIEDL